MDEYYANDIRGQQLGSVIGKGYTNASMAGAIKQSHVEAALDRLAKATECARHELSDLRSRLSPVTQPVPADAEKTANPRPPASCAVEERISDITATVVAIGADLQAARRGLCI